MILLYPSGLDVVLNKLPLKLDTKTWKYIFLLKYHPPTFFRTPLYNIMCEKCISTSFYNSDPFPSHPYPSVALPLDFNISIDVYNH
jgi:hypothetical protein